MNKLLYILPVCCILIYVSCQNDAVNMQSPEDYFNYVNNPTNGYIQVVEKKDIKIECKYKPQEFEAITRLGNENITTAKIDSVKKILGPNSFYELKIFHGKKPDENIQMYTGYYLEKDLRMVTDNGDTLLPSTYMCEPYNGVSPYQRVLLSFPLGKAKQDNHQIIITGIGNQLFKDITFDFSAKAIKKTELKLTD